VIVQCDVQKGSFLAALSLADGKELWRTPREESSTWCTPTVLDAAGDRKAQILVNGYKHIGAYDLAAGTEIWKFSGGGDVPVPAPVVAHELVFLTSAHGQFHPLRAVPVGAKGTLTAADLAWNQPSAGIYMQTPLVYGEEIYACNDGGVLGCYDARTGEQIYRERLGDGTSGFSSSAVGAEGKIYFTSEEGRVHVIAAGPDFEVLAVNPLGETCLATPALSEGVLFFRTREHLLAIAEGTQASAGKQ
jgi:outer membrane protein assembly factor BamB